MAAPPTTTSSSVISGGPPRSKTLYLIRHAESLENERLASLTRSLSRISRLSLPLGSDLRRSAELLNVPAQVDSDVSDAGWDQINQLADRLKADNFLAQRGVGLVVHSPLERARQTSRGMLGCEAPSTLVPPVRRVLETDMLLEKHPTEWIPGNGGEFAERIERFEAWVCEQPEDGIAVVGHSQFFKAMLGLDYKFGNCDVWEVTLTCGQGGSAGGSVVEEEKKDDAPTAAAATEEGEGDTELPGGWSGLKNLYRYEGKAEEECPS